MVVGGVHGCGGQAWLWGAFMVVGGHAWLVGMHGCGGMYGCWGHAWLWGACMVAEGGMHGCGGRTCIVVGGHVWLWEGGRGCVWLTRYGQ